MPGELLELRRERDFGAGCNAEKSEVVLWILDPGSPVDDGESEERWRAGHVDVFDCPRSAPFPLGVVGIRSTGLPTSMLYGLSTSSSYKPRGRVHMWRHSRHNRRCQTDQHAVLL